MATLTELITLQDKLSSKLKKNQKIIKKLNNTRAAPKLNTRDNLSKNLITAKKRIQKLDGTVCTATLKINDKATPAVDRINERFSKIKSAIVSTTSETVQKATKMGYDSIEMYSRIGATTNLTQEEAREVIGDVYYKQKLGQSKAEVAVSTREFARQGFRGEDLKSAVSAAHKFAQLAGKDITEVKTAMIDMYKNMGMAPAETGDLLAYIFKNSREPAQDLLKTVSEYGSAWAKSKIDAGQLAAAFIAGSKDGVHGYNELAEAMNNPLDVTGQLNWQWQQMSQDNPIIPISDTMRDFEKIVNDVGESIITGIAPAFANLQQWLQSKAGQEAIARFSDSISKLAVLLGSVLAAAIKFTIEHWDLVAPAILAVLGGLQAFAFYITKLKPLGAALKSEQGMKFFKNLKNAAKFAGTVILKIFSGVGKFLKLILSLGGRAIGIGSKFLPFIGWLVTAITAVWLAFKNWDKLTEFVGDVFTHLATIFQQIKVKFMELKDTALAKFTELKEGIQEMIAGLPEKMKNKAQEMVENIKDGIAEKASLVKKAFQELFTPDLPPVVTRLLKWFEDKRPVQDTGRLLPRSESEQILNGVSGTGKELISKKINIQQLIGEVIVQNEADENRLAVKIKSLLEKELEKELYTSGGGIYA